MGYYMEIASMGDLNEMISNSGRFFGRPYGAYIIALATRVDEEALEWLYDYREAMDSLTGELVAFVLFYNEAELKIESSTGDFGRNHPAVMMTVRDIIKERKEPENLPLARGRKLGFATAMTYGSDAVARELEIIDQLPCFVVFDDASSNSGVFHTLPMTGQPSDFQVLRELMSGFVADPANAAYSAVARKWDRAAARRLELLNRVSYLPHKAGGSSKVAEAKREIAEIDRQLAAYVEQLNHLPKPSLGPHVDEILKDRKRSARMKGLRKSASAIATNTPTVLDTVVKTASSLGYM
ncbi:hypothetical protein AB0J82_22140 [Asanoa sp. NPDC049518]|uniref:hypothetical protein n=1 Tax=unclassified Asanoa TaxID=2685164 RepID=UPI003422CEAB